MRSLLIAAGNLVAQHSHNSCGRYAADPNPNCCLLCALEYELRKMFPSYGDSQRKSSVSHEFHENMESVMKRIGWTR